ncbi:MAG: maleylacetoacetate isomerase, partial [Pseudomonadota bacterium]|nr:maleylacetoacetate isomerase [Pseudomonadota bacterium]
LAIDGMMMTQSLAIIEYLDWRMPQPPLIPADPADAARLRAIAYAIAMDTHPICNPSVVAHHAAAFNGNADDKAGWMRYFIDKGLSAVEALADHPKTGTFLHGKNPGLADVVLVPQLYNARRWGVALKNMPRLVAVEEACLSLAAFMAAAPESVRPADG